MGEEGASRMGAGLDRGMSEWHLVQATCIKC